MTSLEGKKGQTVQGGAPDYPTKNGCDGGGGGGTFTCNNNTKLPDCDTWEQCPNTDETGWACKSHAPYICIDQ